jgi:hypothetical protein
LRLETIPLATGSELVVKTIGNGFGFRHRGAHAGQVATDQHDGDVALDEVGRQRRQPIVLTVGPTIFDRNVSALHIARLPETATESGHWAAPFRRRQAVEHADHRR